MLNRIRTFLVLEVLVFVSAALLHAGVTFTGYEDAGAAIAETVIAVALLAGLALGMARPAWARDAAIATQAFATLGTCVGLTLILIGVGPRTIVDVAYHIIMLALLITGLRSTCRMPSAYPAVRA